MKKLLTFLIKFAATFVLAIILLEILINLSEISLPSRVYDDPKFGRSHRPNAKVMEISAEGFSMGKVNRYGYLGPAYAPARSSQSTRIALIGDSYVAGLQLFDRHHFRKILEDELFFLTQGKIEVLNFGIGGIDLRGMYILYQEKVLKYEPDLVLFFVKREDLVKKDTLPVPELYVENDIIKIDYDFINSEEFKLRKKYAFIRKIAAGSLIKEAYEYYKMGKTFEILLEKLNPYNLKVFKKSEKTTTNNKERERFFDKNRAIFKSLAKMSKSKTNKNIIVKTDEFLPSYVELINKLDLTIFDLNRELLEQEKKGRNLRYWKATNKIGHWNHLSHRVIAKFLAREILSLNKRFDANI